jgi:hypothetical protein
MPKPHLLPTLVLAAALLLPAAAAHAQDEATDTRLDELQALVPENLAGLQLRDELQMATGEDLAAVMTEDERTVLEGMLQANGKTLTDYAAVSATLPITDDHIAVVQAHRVTGVDASRTIEAWVKVLGLDADEPLIKTEVIASRDVTLLSDAARPDVPQLFLFPAGDVVWMVVAADRALVEEAVEVLGTSSEPGEAASAE